MKDFEHWADYKEMAMWEKPMWMIAPWNWFFTWCYRQTQLVGGGMMRLFWALCIFIEDIGTFHHQIKLEQAARAGNRPSMTIQRHKWE